MQNKANAVLNVFGFTVHPEGMQLTCNSDVCKNVPGSFKFCRDTDTAKYILLYSHLKVPGQYSGTAVAVLPHSSRVLGFIPCMI